MGVAVRSKTVHQTLLNANTNQECSAVASFLGLHREETYSLEPDSSASAVIESEVARRTFWILQGTGSPVVLKLHLCYSLTNGPFKVRKAFTPMIPCRPRSVSATSRHSCPAKSPTLHSEESRLSEQPFQGRPRRSRIPP
jgi:hypothetical protein